MEFDECDRLSGDGRMDVPRSAADHCICSTGDSAAAATGLHYFLHRGRWNRNGFCYSRVFCSRNILSSCLYTPRADSDGFEVL